MVTVEQMPIYTQNDPKPKGKIPAVEKIEADMRDKIRNIDELNSDFLSPHEMNIPWFSHISASRQSKYWKNAQETTEAFLQAMYTHSKAELPIELDREDKVPSEIRKAKEKEIIETAVRSAATMLPTASPERAVLLAQSMLLMESPSPLDLYARNVLQEDSVIGKEHLESTLAWLQHTQRHRKNPVTSFDSLRSYLNFRSEDIGMEFVLSMISFACGVHLSFIERAQLGKVIVLCSDHLSLVNDVYSFDKEYRAFREAGFDLINAVQIIRSLLSVDIPRAKQVAVNTIQDIEVEIHAEVKRLEDSSILTRSQQVFLDMLICCIAGHTFYSATAIRFRPV
ncbi:hypothetical protein ASPZODRAFT_155078 [Penicilliopsis zonata CBS 506.65]|uniref:Terpene synthase n=1 Tax=Penicilliopsis zonata CBS 506.65 TaxID=1073090 RepID=A0A1L9S6L5_9EURO|nr:hypothetical protein ASPZODRAFT_155078 [Penicilliopsis zonata CBS 506.65]OJJ42824.1 hypothetical protein ASPZODRAFT_155078 [Penicilliopsis zonata CBS 506.65]